MVISDDFCKRQKQFAQLRAIQFSIDSIPKCLKSRKQPFLRYINNSHSKKRFAALFPANSTTSVRVTLFDRAAPTATTPTPATGGTTLTQV